MVDWKLYGRTDRGLYVWRGADQLADFFNTTVDRRAPISQAGYYGVAALMKLKNDSMDRLWDNEAQVYKKL